MQPFKTEGVKACFVLGDTIIFNLFQESSLKIRSWYFFLDCKRFRKSALPAKYRDFFRLSVSARNLYVIPSKQIPDVIRL